MKQLSKYKLNKIGKNIDLFFNLATSDEIRQGKQWYISANNFCNDVAKQYNCSPFIVAQVVSALSPRNKWAQNLKDAKKVFKAIKDGKTAEQIKVCTFNKNKFKAFQIAKGLQQISSDSRKTYNFCKNIAFLDDDFLTVDIWHLRACLKEFKSISNAQIGKLAYEQIKQLTIKKAQKLGLKGYELQAIIWVTVQNNINILK